MRVLHITSGLGTGGAERSLLALVREQSADLANEIDSVRVASLTAADALAAQFPRTPWVFDLKQGKLAALGQLVSAARAFAPDVIQGWMYHGNLAASWVGWRLQVPVIWSVRHSLAALDQETLATRLVVRLGSSRCLQPKRVVYNSHAGWATHLPQGYGHKPSMIIANGVDINHFTMTEPRPQQNRAERSVLGCVARFHPMKGIARLLQAHAALQATRPCDLWLAGAGMTADNAQLAALIAQHSEPAHVRCLGEVADIREVYAQLDVLVLPSLFGEGTPNALLEGMACGVPCVATRVGDAARVISDPSWLTEPGDVAGLQRTIARALALAAAERNELAATNRAHVQEHFSLTRCHARYQAIYNELVAGPGSGPASGVAA